MSGYDGPVPVTPPKGAACFCDVPPGWKHTDECMRLYVYPKARYLDHFNDARLAAREAIVEAADVWADHQEPSWESAVPLLEAVHAYRAKRDAYYRERKRLDGE